MTPNKQNKKQNTQTESGFHAVVRSQFTTECLVSVTTAMTSEEEEEEEGTSEESWSCNTWCKLPALPLQASVAEFNLIDVGDQVPGQVDPHHLLRDTSAGKYSGRQVHR